jgi:hypothetical protein
MTKILIATLISLAGAAAAGTYADDIASVVVPAASETAAELTTRRIADAAYLDHLLGTTWQDALTTTVATARNNDALTLDGTTLTWRHGDQCFTAELPTPDTDPQVRPC